MAGWWTLPDLPTMELQALVPAARFGCEPKEDTMTAMIRTITAAAGIATLLTLGACSTPDNRQGKKTTANKFLYRQDAKNAKKNNSKDKMVKITRR